jgi:PAS domain S-box-containing protein
VIAIFDHDGIIRYESPSVEGVLGYTPDELVGTTLLKHIHPDDFASVSELFSRLRGGSGVITTEELRFRHRDGSWRWIEGVGRNLLDDASVKGILWNYRDVTERKLAEEALHRREEELTQIFNNANDVIVFVNLNGEVRNVNSRIKEVLGISPEEAIGRSFAELGAFSTEVLSDLSLFLMKAVTEKTAFMPLMRVQARHKAGYSVILGLSCSAVLTPSGELSGFTAIIRDVTEIERKDQALRDSEERFRSLIENASDAINIVTADGTIAYESPSAVRMLGYDGKEGIGRSMLEYVHPDDIAAITASMAETLANPKQVGLIQTRLRHADGSWRWVEGSGTNLLDDPKVRGIVCNYRDVTQRKMHEEELREYATALSRKNIELDEAREELAELNRELEGIVEERTAEIRNLVNQKDEFIIRLGHDLKSPLTPLLALLPMILEDERDDDKRQMLEVLLNNVTFMKDLVVKTLHLAKVSSAISGVSPEPLVLAQVVKSVAGARETVATQRRITIRTDIDDSILVNADRLGLEEVVDNLAVNAIKFTPEGGTVTVHAQQDSECVTVSVTDTGMGMTEEQLSHVFEEFYKGDPSRTDLESSGLGLSICRRIVERGGGRIWAETAGIGQGSSFHFTLKLAEANVQSKETPVEVG